MRAQEFITLEMKQRLDAKCWKGKHKAGTKIKGGIRVNNCVPNESINEDWNKVNHHDKTDGLSQKAVNAYRREHPGSKLKTAVTTKPSKLKKGSKSASRRKSFCARMGGMKKHRTGAKNKHNPDSPINKALRRWHCESIEEMQELIMLGEQYIATLKENFANGKHPEDKGDSKRYGVPTKASVSTLRKVAHQGGRKGQLAHWMANMKAGKAKHAGK
jgi:Domain of unknown function (DUF6321)